MEYRKIICVVLSALLLFAGCASRVDTRRTPLEGDISFQGSVSLSSNLFTHLDDEEKTGGLTDMTLEGYEKVAENENLALYLRQESASIRVLNKKSGYVWGALRSDKPEGLNKTWSAFANSIVSIKYYDVSGNITQTGAGHQDNTCSFRLTDRGLNCDVVFGKAKISLSVELELMDDHIRFHMDDASIREDGDYMLAQVYFAPFLGSTIEDEIGGYIFVPDGSGALIRFRKQRQYLSGFNARIYGSDYGIDNLFVVGDLNANRTNDFLKDAETVSLPVYGIAHGKDSNALFGYVEQGGEYGAIFAEPAQPILNYNYAGAYFIYRQIYQQPTGRNGAGIQVVQKDRNEVNPALSVYFLEGQEANYNGMAHTCRKILMADGLPAGRNAEKSGLRMDFLAADVRQGFLLNTTARLTQREDLLEAVSYLKAQGIDRMEMNLLGWQKGGLNGYEKLKTDTSSVIDHLGELDTLLREQNCALSLYLAPLSAKEGQAAKTDLGITLSQSVIRLERDNDQVFLGDTQYLKTQRALTVLEKQVAILQKEGVDGITLDQVSCLLYSENLRGHAQNRLQVRQAVEETVAALAGSQGLPMYRPNAYLLNYTSQYLDMPMSCSRYVFETDVVPFLQLVLSGSMELYAPYANQSFYTDMDVLRCIAYGVYPSFLFTGSDSAALKDTPSEEYFSTCFDDWKEIAVSIYQRIDSVLSFVQGQNMCAYQVLFEGVVRTDYASGSIYINYTDTPVTAGTVQIPALSAIYVAH